MSRGHLRWHPSWMMHATGHPRPKSLHQQPPRLLALLTWMPPKGALLPRTLRAIASSWSNSLASIIDTYTVKRAPPDSAQDTVLSRKMRRFSLPSEQAAWQPRQHSMLPGQTGKLLPGRAWRPHRSQGPFRPFFSYFLASSRISARARRHLSSVSPRLAVRTSASRSPSALPIPAKLLTVVPPRWQAARPVVPVTNVLSRGSARRMWRSSSDLPVPAQPAGLGQEGRCWGQMRSRWGGKRWCRVIMCWCS